MRVGNRLAAELRQRQWSRADLAAATDIPYAVVRRLARPGSDPALDYALRICRVLGVPVETLFTLAPDATTPGGETDARSRDDT
ncbi:MAG TPA: helix-turn-helix transcriptional regulator [Candidatus Binatia bacterium]|nr:helix-turn-helix transcriptional regulator [Candidatus Binatia bacterium]